MKLIELKKAFAKKVLEVCSMDTLRIFTLYLSFFILSGCKSNIEKPVNNKNIAVYKGDIIEATKVLVSHRKLIFQEIDSVHRKEIVAVAFPEIIRYNAFQDLIESSANKILYIEGGKEVANFSVGLFQMKPSFIEDLESYISKTESLKRFSSIIITGVSESKIREERFRRLENTQWQFRYLNIFWYVANEKYKDMKFTDDSERLRLYASAYNCGFLKSDEFIENMIYKEIFPYGAKYKGEQVAFSDLSNEFLNNYSHILNQTFTEHEKL